MSGFHITMEPEFNLEVCRICLGAADVVDLLPLIETNDENSEMFLTITGIEVKRSKASWNVIKIIFFPNSQVFTGDEHESFICVECSSDLKIAYKLWQRAIDAEEFFREMKRRKIEYEKKVDFMRQLGLCPTVFCRTSASSPVESLKEVQELQHGTSKVSNKRVGGDKKKKNSMMPKKKKTFTCPDCSQVLSDKRRLHDHRENIHNQKRRFFCDYCGQGLWIRNSFIRHVKNHVIIKEVKKSEPIKCWLKTCGKVFKTNEALNLHNHIHCSDRSKFD